MVTLEAAVSGAVTTWCHYWRYTISLSATVRSLVFLTSAASSIAPWLSPQLPSPHFSYHTVPPRTPLMLSLPSSLGTFPSSLSVCVPSIVTIFSLRLPCFSLLGDLCVRPDRDILYLSYLVLWENWCDVDPVWLTAMPRNPTPEEGRKGSCLCQCITWGPIQ